MRCACLVVRVYGWILPFQVNQFFLSFKGYMFWSLDLVFCSLEGLTLPFWVVHEAYVMPEVARLLSI